MEVPRIHTVAWNSDGGAQLALHRTTSSGVSRIVIDSQSWSQLHRVANSLQETELRERIYKKSKTEI